MGAFIRRVYRRSADDRIFFLASGLAFGVALAAIPFFLLILSVPTLVFGSQVRTFQDEALRWLWQFIPVTAPQVREEFSGQLRAIVNSAGSIGIIGAVLFAWFSTRLFGALRTALDEVFDLDDHRGVVRGKIFDLQLVLVSTVLLSVNIAATAFLGIWGFDWPRVPGLEPGVLQRAVYTVAPLLMVYAMFFLIYKFVPAKRLHWRTAAMSAAVAAAGFEAVKYAFSWYVANFGNYASIFFAFTTVVLLVLAVYYASIFFILGGEVGQAYHLHRIMRRQREILD